MYNDSRTLVDAAHSLGSGQSCLGGRGTDVSSWKEGPGPIHLSLTRQCNTCLIAGLNKCVLDKQMFSRSFLFTRYNTQEVIENGLGSFTFHFFGVEKMGSRKQEVSGWVRGILWVRV